MMEMQPAIYALIAAIPSFILGWLAYRRSRKVDAVAEQSGVAVEGRAGTAQIIEGLNKIIDNLQEDNQQWRDDFKHMTMRLDVRDQENNDLKVRLMRMHRKYGDNGNGIPNSGPIT